MNTKMAFVAAIAIATALALVVAPAMTAQPASATKVQLCPSGKECQGKSGDSNPNVRCTAGNGDNEPNCGGGNN
jgi:uncharacterized low-complexity protein